MTKLTDIQLVLLSTASQRDDGSLLPPPESLGTSVPRIRRAITQLINAQFAAEVDVTDDARIWRSEDGRKIGVMITQTGRTAIGADEPSKDGEAALPPGPAAAPAPRAGSKQALLVELLQRNTGASLVELTEATSWLPHTTRAAMTGLRKRGFTITSDKVEGTTRYQIAEAA